VERDGGSAFSMAQLTLCALMKGAPMSIDAAAVLNVTSLIALLNRLASVLFSIDASLA
jgi:hypothetical protein